MSPNIPHCLQILLVRFLLPASHKKMPSLRLAALDLHELVEVEHPPLAARPALRTLMEYGGTRMVHAALVISRGIGIVRCFAAAPPASLAGGYGDRRFIVLGFWGRGWRDGGSSRGLCLRRSGRQSSLRASSWHGCRCFDCRSRRRSRRVVDVGVLASCARRDGEELVEGQDARLAAFPACVPRSALCMQLET